MAQQQSAVGGEYDNPPERAPKRAIITCLGAVTPRPVEWLWPQRIAIGKLTLLVGRPGQGKSLLTIDAASRVSRGVPFPDCRDVPNPAGDVVLLNCEDDLEDTVRPRVDAAEGDPNRVYCIEGVEATDSSGDGGSETYRRGFALDVDLPRLEETLDACKGVRLVSVDPITGFLGETDSHRDASVRAVLAPLAELAMRRRVAVVAVMHLNKSAASGQTAMERVSGSGAFIASCRLAHLTIPDPRQGADPRTQLFLPLKSNLTGETPGLSYVIEAGSDSVPRLLWQAEPVALTADEALNPTTNRVGTKTAEAAAWLRGELEAGAVYSDALEQRRRENRISDHSFKAAKKLLGVRSRKASFDGRWVLHLPGPESAPAQEGDPPPVHKLPPPWENDRPLGDFDENDRPLRRRRPKTQGGDLDDNGTRPPPSGASAGNDDPPLSTYDDYADPDDDPEAERLGAILDDDDVRREREDVRAVEAEAEQRSTCE